MHSERDKTRVHVTDCLPRKTIQLVSCGQFTKNQCSNFNYELCTHPASAVEGSGGPEACPAGTFSPAPGLSSEAGCQPCTSGFYCREPGLTAPTAPCSQGDLTPGTLGNQTANVELFLFFNYFMFFFFPPPDTSVF